MQMGGACRPVEVNMTTLKVNLSTAAALLLAGCVGAPENQADRENDVGIARSELLTMNALTMNALTMNALTMNALTMNALTMNALSPSTLSAIQDPSATGNLSRQFLKYTVGCALDATQSFSFSWTDTANVVHSETYWGLLGLSPKWDKHAFKTKDQEWVTACVLSRVNWYGTPVSISARGPTGALHTFGPDEIITHPNEEGAFWGNIFAPNPVAYSCDYTPNAAHSRSMQRDCATGHIDASNNPVDCGIIHHLGSCDTYCDPLNSKGTYIPRCDDGAGTKSNSVLTIFLE
jgi:hypothetical protein